jgi:type VI protein secretion system component VasK
MDNVAQYLQMMDLNGQTPTMQNIGNQRDLYNQNMAGMKALSEQALSGKQTSPLQSLADALRAQQKPGLGQMLNEKGNIVNDPTYGNLNQSSVMQNPTNNPYENPV